MKLTNILSEALLHNTTQALKGKTIKIFKSNGYGKGYTVTFTDGTIVDIKGGDGTVYVSKKS